MNVLWPGCELPDVFMTQYFSCCCFFCMVIRVYAVGSSYKLRARLEPFFKPIVSHLFFFQIVKLGRYDARCT